MDFLGPFFLEKQAENPQKKSTAKFTSEFGSFAAKTNIARICSEKSHLRLQNRERFAISKAKWQGHSALRTSFDKPHTDKTMHWLVRSRESNRNALKKRKLRSGKLTRSTLKGGSTRVF